MNHRSIATTIILVVTTVTMGQDKYPAQRVLPQHLVESPSVDTHGRPLGIWKPGGDLPLDGGTRKSDPFNPLLSDPLGSLDLSALGSRESRLRQWLADSSLSFSSIRGEFLPDRHHAGSHIDPPVHPPKPDLHKTVDHTFPNVKTPVIDPWLNGGNVGAKVFGGVLPAANNLLSGFNNDRFPGVNNDPLVHSGLVDKFPGVGQVVDTFSHTGVHPKPNVKNPVVKDAFVGNSYDGIRDSHVLGPFLGADHGAAKLDPLRRNVPGVIDPIVGAGLGAGKVDTLVVPGGSFGGLVHDPRRTPIGGFPTGY